MPVKLVFSFAAGLLIATSVLGGTYFFGSDHETSKQNQVVKDPSEKEMKEALASKGYVIHTEAEWNEVIASVEPVKEEEKDTQNENESKSEEEKTVTRTTLTVSEGMTSIDVGEILVKANIIEDAFAFSQVVEKKGVAKYLRLGTYEIDSDMTVDKIIATIFK